MPDLVLARESEDLVGGWDNDWRVGRSTIAREEKGLSDQEWRRNPWGSQDGEGSCYQLTNIRSKRLFKAGAGLAKRYISVLACIL